MSLNHNVDDFLGDSSDDESLEIQQAIALSLGADTLQTLNSPRTKIVSRNRNRSSKGKISTIVEQGATTPLHTTTHQTTHAESNGKQNIVDNEEGEEEIMRALLENTSPTSQSPTHHASPSRKRSRDQMENATPQPENRKRLRSLVRKKDTQTVTQIPSPVETHSIRTTKNLFGQTERDISSEYCGIYNDGNTCHLNAILQYLFLSPMRNIIMRKLLENANLSATTPPTTNDQSMRRILKEFLNKESEPATKETGTSTPTFIQTLRQLFLQLLLTKKSAISAKPLIQCIPNKKYGSQEDVVETWDSIRDLIEQQLDPEDAQEFKQLLYGETIEYHPKEQPSKDAFQVLRLPLDDSIESIHDALKKITHPQYDTDEQSSQQSTISNTSQRHMYFSKLPPILTFQLHRVKFDRAQKELTKTGRCLEYPSTLYMDRYHCDNSELVGQIEQQIAKYETQIRSAKDQMNLVDQNMWLSSLENVLHYIDTIHPSTLTHNVKTQLEEERDRLSAKMNEMKQFIHQCEKEIEELNEQISQDMKYHLFAVHMHQGGAKFGHYWVYVNVPGIDSNWIKLNDSKVSCVPESEVFSAGSGCYMLVYVREDHFLQLKPLGEMVSQIPESMMQQFENQERILNQLALDNQNAVKEISHNGKQSEPITISDDEDEESMFVCNTTSTLYQFQQDVKLEQLHTRTERFRALVEQLGTVSQRAKSEAQASDWFHPRYALHFETYLFKTGENVLANLLILSNLYSKFFPDKKLSLIAPQDFTLLCSLIEDDTPITSDIFAKLEKLLGMVSKYLHEKFRKMRFLMQKTAESLSNFNEKLRWDACKMILRAIELEKQQPEAVRSEMTLFLCKMYVVGYLMCCLENIALQDAYIMRALNECHTCIYSTQSAALWSFMKDYIVPKMLDSEERPESLKKRVETWMTNITSSCSEGTIPAPEKRTPATDTLNSGDGDLSHRDVNKDCEEMKSLWMRAVGLSARHMMTFYRFLKNCGGFGESFPDAFWSVAEVKVMLEEEV